MKNNLVQFWFYSNDIRSGEREFKDFYLFKKKQSEFEYCSDFTKNRHKWGLAEKDELEENVFWDQSGEKVAGENAISVHFEKEITEEEVKVLKNLKILPPNYML